MRPLEDGMWQRRRVVVDQRPAIRLVSLAMAAPGLELLRRDTTADVADQGRRRDDGREWHITGEDGDERGGRNRPQHVVLQGARTDPMRRLYHDGGNGRLDTVEQPGDQRHLAKGDIDPGQGNENEERRQ